MPPKFRPRSPFFVAGLGQAGIYAVDVFMIKRLVAARPRLADPVLAQLLDKRLGVVVLEAAKGPLEKMDVRVDDETFAGQVLERGRR